jgi:3-deoxy-7-phosphoheptulonate synthase
VLIFELQKVNQVDKAQKTLLDQEVDFRIISLWNRVFFLASPSDSNKALVLDLLNTTGAEFITDSNAENPLSSRVLKKEFSDFNLGKNVNLSEKTTLFIGGPCAIESRGQIDETAETLSGLGVSALRAGAFKPRTSIYSFQGLEYRGLKLLREAADKHNMIVVTEAKDTSHIDAVIEYSDVIQIGTKSMYVFDLLRRAGESGKPVMLKRGFMTTIKEYMQALDVILATGNERVIMCERGLRTFETQTRFTLDLAGAAVLKLNSHLPLIIDPSHTTGRRDIVAPLCRAGVALGVEGLLVEIHPNPDEALSDREQAFPLKDVPQLLESLRRVATAVDRELV